MHSINAFPVRRLVSMVAMLAVAAVATVPPFTVAAQASSQDQQVAKQLADLRAEVARLKAALAKQQSMPSTGAPTGAMQPGMKRMDDMGEMGGMGAKPAGAMPMGDKAKKPMGGMMDDMMGAGAMSGGMGRMDMHKGEMGMPPDSMKMMDDDKMSSMKPKAGGMPSAKPKAAAGSTMPGMTMPSAPTTGSTSAAATTPRSMSSMPGVPGTSHVYHVGSTGFFLDQPQIGLTSDQKTALAKIKERAMVDRANAERRIAQAEQDLWTLTGADQPDAPKVQAKAREIEELRATQRLAFIEAVGEATKLLTAEQRSKLLGVGNPSAK